jgi:hypothetical protein
VHIEKGSLLSVSPGREGGGMLLDVLLFCDAYGFQNPTPNSPKCWVWWYIPVIQATQEAKAGDSLVLMSSKPA